MALNDIAIRIAADFVGLPAFKKADTAVDKLYKSTKKLAAGFGAAFSAAAITRYGVASVRAFAAEEKQIAALTATVKSLNLAFMAPELNNFIEDLERTTGIAREELQPAFQKLLTQTGSVTRSQEILASAVQVSFSGIMSVSEAANALTQAYVGNVKGLKQFNLGLTNTELQAMSFDQILQTVSKTYKNQYAAALETTAVKMDKLNVAAGNAKETIGGGLVDAFANLAGNGNIDKATAKLEGFATALADTLRAATKGGVKGLLSFLNPATTGVTANPNINPQGANLGSPAAWRARNAAITKAAADAAAKAKKLEDAKLATLRKQTAEKRAQTALDNANKALSGAKSMFDMEGIQIAAALQGNITEEQRKRLELMQKIWELEQAIDAGNTSLIEKLTKQLEELTKQTAQLNANFAALTKINDILNTIGYGRQLFDLDNLSRALDMLNSMTGSTYTVQNFASSIPQDLYKPLLIDFANAAAEQVVVPEVNISIDGSVSDLIDVVVNGLQNKSASGVDTRILRNTGGFNW